MFCGEKVNVNRVTASSTSPMQTHLHADTRQLAKAIDSLFVTLHHKMSRNVPDGHFLVLYFLKVNSMLFTMVKTIFKSED